MAQLTSQARGISDVINFAGIIYRVFNPEKYRVDMENDRNELISFFNTMKAVRI